MQIKKATQIGTLITVLSLIVFSFSGCAGDSTSEDQSVAESYLENTSSTEEFDDGTEEGSIIETENDDEDAMSEEEFELDESPVEDDATIYESALELMDIGDYYGAIEIFEGIITFQDASEKINECYYCLAVDAYSSEDYDTAITYFELISFKFKMSI